MLVLSSIYWLIKYIQSSSSSNYIGREFTIDVLGNTVNFSDTHRKRFLRHLQKCMLQGDAYIAKFQALIEQGPYYICTVCHILLYRKSVVTLSLTAYELRDIITDILPFYNEKYICKTCHNKLRKNKKLCQAVCNKLHVSDVPEELKILNRLETISVDCTTSLFSKNAYYEQGTTKKNLRSSL